MSKVLVNPITIYLDCDDTILYSSETVIRILNQRYGENKTISDLSDWFYRSIVPGISQEEILGIYDSEEFWNEVELNPEFLEVFKKLKNNFNWVILSRGKEQNIKLKTKFIEKHLGIPVFGLAIESSSDSCTSKKKVDMSDSIQIDDNMGCIEGTNAAIKILLQHRNLSWNQPEPHEDNLYIAHDWKEIGEALEFFLRCPSMVKKCYGEDSGEGYSD